MKISKQSRRDAKRLFRSCQIEGVVDDQRVRGVVQAMLNTKPRGFMGILEHFKRLIKLDLDRRTAVVQSSIPLGAAGQQRVERALLARYGSGLHLSFEVNPGLIGGLRVQIGSDVFDGSVLARLNSLAESF